MEYAIIGLIVFFGINILGHLSDIADRKDRNH